MDSMVVSCFFFTTLLMLEFSSHIWWPEGPRKWPLPGWSRSSPRSARTVGPSGARWGSGNRCRNFLETLGMSTYCWLYFWLHTRYGSIWCFRKIGVPLNHPCYFLIFHYKPSILGYPHLWKRPYNLYICIYIYIHITHDGISFGSPMSSP